MTPMREIGPAAQSPLDREPLAKRFIAWFGCTEGATLRCFWRCLVDLGLILWITRAPVTVTALAYLIIGQTPQAQDLIIPLAESNVLRIAAFFILQFILLAMPTHYSARLLLDDDLRFHILMEKRASGYLRWLERWVPRLLGLATFGAIILSAYRAIINLPILPDDPQFTAAITTHLYELMGWAAAAALVFGWYVVQRSALAETALVQSAEREAHEARRFLGRLEIAPQASRTVEPDRSDHGDLGRLLLMLEFALFVVVLLAGPSLVAEWLPRAFALALVLGGWLPVLTYLSAIGRRVQAPLIFASFLIVAGLTALLGDNHDVRRIDSDASGVDSKQSRIALEDAVELWKSENDCSGSDCPRPIIVAAAGGASRAGFFTASVIGELLDKASLHGLDETTVRKRIFAISGVSGGSTGAVMIAAALAAGGTQTRFPCPHKPFDLWYGRIIENWRGCLETLMSGDFLTPTFIGLTFHDAFPFGPWRDRAAMLEQSWERRFADVISQGIPDPAARSCPADLKCPFLSLRPRPGSWIPLLVLNAMSVGTGQRIVTTPLKPDYRAAHCPGTGTPQACRLFAETFHFHDLLLSPASTQGWHSNLQRVLTGDYLLGRKPHDIRLSTAAHNSARFPIISPPGGIRNDEQHMVDRIVDGGYFENYGVSTALELAKAVHAMDSALAPFVLVISNDPGVPLDADRVPDNTRDTDFLTDLSSLFHSVSRARDARGTLAVAQLRSELEALDGKCGSAVAHIRVWPQDAGTARPACDQHSGKARAVSMSWWLSSPVQLHLIEQIDGKDNCNKDQIAKIWKAIESVCVR